MYVYVVVSKEYTIYGVVSKEYTYTLL